MRILYCIGLFLLPIITNADTVVTQTCRNSEFCDKGTCDDGDGQCVCWEGWTGPHCTEELGSDDYGAKSRKRRALPAAATTTTVDFFLNKEAPFDLVTTLCPGGRIHFILTIHLPPTTDLQVELFTPDNSTTHMALCDVKVTRCGSNIVERTFVLAVKPTMVSKTGNNQYDQAIMDFGNLSNSETTTTDHTFSSFDIEFDAVQVPNTQTVDGDQYWVSAGAEYLSQSYIWVGQASFTLNLACPATPSPTFTLAGSSTVEIGSSELYTVNMNITMGSGQLLFDALSPIDGVGDVYVCSAKIIAAGKDFDCLNTLADGTIVPERITSTTYNGYERIRLDFGTIINKGAFDNYQELADDNLIQVEFSVCAKDDTGIVGLTKELGAALQLGNTQIWAGSFNITLTPRVNTATALPSPPNITMTAAPATVSVGMPVWITVEIEIPENTNTEYTVEFQMPYNSGPRFSVCSAVVVFQGENLPCLKDSAEAVFTAQDTVISTLHDKVVLDLGRLRNTGHFPGSTYPDANKIKIQATSVTLMHADNVDTATASFAVDVTYGPDTTRPSDTVTIDSSATPYSMNQDQYPQWSMNFTMGDGVVSTGGMTVVEINMKTMPSTFYTNLDTEVMVPIIDGEYLYQICEVRLLHSGDNLACFDNTAAQASITPLSNFSDGIYDQFTIALGATYNKRVATAIMLDPDDDDVRLEAVVRIRNHASNINGFENWISSGFRFHPLKLWVGQLKVQASVPGTPIDPADLYASVIRQDGAANTDLFIGKSVRYSVILKMKHYTQGPVILKVAVAGDSKLNVCAMYLVYAGPYMGCGYDTDINATYTTRSGTVDEYEAAELDLGVISNIGAENMTADDTVDNATIQIDFVVHVNKIAVDSDSLPVDVQLNSGLNTDIVSTLDQTIIARTPVQSTGTASSTLPTYTFTQAPINAETLNSNILPGESKRFFFDIYFTEDSSNEYNVKFLSPVNYTGAMEVCGIIVNSVGKNLPCLQRSMFKNAAVFTQRSGSDYNDVGSISLGYVCHFPIVNDTEENKIRLEVVGRAPRHLALMNLVPNAQAIWFSGTVKVNADQIYVTQRSLTVTYDNSTWVDTVGHDPSQAKMEFVDPTPISARPGSTFTVRLNISTPLDSALVGNLEVRTDVSTSAEMTLSSIYVAPSNNGRNLGCFTSFPDIDFFSDLTSTQQTSQLTKGTLNLGIITNSGLSVRDEDTDPTADQFFLDIDIQMADSIANEANYQTNLSVALSLGSGVVLVASRDIGVLRDNLEKSNLHFSVNVTNDTSVYKFGYKVALVADLRHEDDSSAEAQNVSIVMYHPPYMSFSAITWINMTETTNHPTVSQLPNGQGVVFFFHHVYFTDIITWEFDLEVVSTTSRLQAGVTYDATTPYELYNNIIYRPSSTHPSGEWHVTPLDYLTYFVLPSADLADTPVVLGMASGVILDCQLEASVGSDPAVNARPTNAGWKAANRGASYKPYYQVHFGNIARVTEVMLTVPTGFTPDVTVANFKYDVYTSNDRFVWTHIEQRTGPGDLGAPAIGRSFRISVNKQGMAADDVVGFKLELKGYYVSNDVLPADICKAADVWEVTTPPSVMYYRGFLAQANSLFYCDLVAPGDENVYDERVECYRTVDGSTWQMLDKSVFNVIGYDASNNHLYGLCSDKKSFLISDDNGQTWYSVAQAKYDAATKTAATGVPFAKTATFQDSLPDPDASFRDASGTVAGAHFRGMYWYNSGTWTQVSDWNSCC